MSGSARESRLHQYGRRVHFPQYHPRMKITMNSTLDKPAADVTSTDYVASLLDKGRARAHAEQLRSS